MGTSAALSVSTVFAVAGGILIAIGFGTNYWQVFSVSRDRLSADRNEIEDHDIGRREAYFSRTYGLFRKCFTDPEEKPLSALTYKSPLGDDCTDIHYDTEIQENFAEQLKEYYHLRRTYIALYVVGLGLALISLLFLIAGCGKQSAKLIIVTGVMLFISGAFVAGAIGVWHKVRYMLSSVLLDFGDETQSNDENIDSWPQVLTDATEVTYGWSYICAWVGVGCLLIAAIALCASANTLKRSKVRRHRPGKAVGPTVYSSGAAYDNKGAVSQTASPYAHMNYATTTGASPGGYAAPYNGSYAYNPYAYYGPYNYLQYYGYGSSGAL